MTSQKVKTFECPNIETLSRELIALSEENPMTVYTAMVTFQKATIYRHKNLSSIPVDSPMSRCMLDTYNNIAVLNGKLVPPPTSWKKRNIAQENRTHAR